MINHGEVSITIIKELRERAGMSQEELSNKMGLDRSAIAKWEAGVSSPTAGKLPALAAALGCSIDELFREDTAAPEPPAPESVAG